MPNDNLSDFFAWPVSVVLAIIHGVFFEVNNTDIFFVITKQK